MSDTDGWNGPRRGGEDDFGRWTDIIRDLQKRLAAVERGAPLRAAGIGVNEDGMVVGSSLGVTGDLNVSGDAAFSGDLDVSGDAEFSGDTIIGGNAAITGTLSLPNGIINNDALANPIAFGSGFADNDGFSLAAAGANVCSFNMVVPAGYTKALVTALGVISAFNTTATLDYLRARVYIDSSTGHASFGRRLITPLTSGNGSGDLAVNKMSEVTGLVGGATITCRLFAETDFANLPAHVANGASINAQAIFLR